MFVVACVKTFLSDVGKRPVRCSCEEQSGVVRCGIVCVLGGVIANVVSDTIPVDTIDPFPNIINALDGDGNIRPHYRRASAPSCRA